MVDAPERGAQQRSYTMTSKGVSIGACEVIAETDRAILADLGDEELWVPKSQLHDDSEVWKKDQEGELVVSRWFAAKLGMI
jgi:hypothetical protein